MVCCLNGAHYGLLLKHCFLRKANQSMDTSQLLGVIPAMATPFTPNFDLDENLVFELINGYIDAGVHGISVAGSQAEFFALDTQEHLRLIELAEIGRAHV